MPTYSYRCTSCEEIREDDSTMSGFKDHHPECLSCKSPCDYIYVPSVPQVAFKDGASGSWPSKGGRFQRHRAQQAEAAERRQRERYGHLSKGAIPNYNGVETESWREAQSHAIKERGLESGLTYSDKIKEEQSKSVK